MAETGPSLNFLQRRFGPSFGTKKRTEDINLPSKRQDIRAENDDYEAKRKKKSESSGGVFSKLRNPDEDSTLGKVKKGYGIFKNLAKG